MSNKTVTPLQISQAQAKVLELEEGIRQLKELLNMPSGHQNKTPPRPPHNPEHGIGKPRPEVIGGNRPPLSRKT